MPRTTKEVRYIEKDTGKETQHAKEVTKKYNKELNELAEEVRVAKRPAKTAINMPPYTVGSNPADMEESRGILRILQEHPDMVNSGLKRITLLKEAYVTTSKAARAQGENINLVRKGDVLSIENGILTVKRAGGRSFKVPLYDWEDKWTKKEAVSSPASEPEKEAKGSSDISGDVAPKDVEAEDVAPINEVEMPDGGAAPIEQTTKPVEETTAPASGELSTGSEVPEAQKIDAEEQAEQAPETSAENAAVPAEQVAAPAGQEENTTAPDEQKIDIETLPKDSLSEESRTILLRGVKLGLEEHGLDIEPNPDGSFEYKGSKVKFTYHFNAEGVGLDIEAEKDDAVYVKRSILFGLEQDELLDTIAAASSNEEVKWIRANLAMQTIDAAPGGVRDNVAQLLKKFDAKDAETKTSTEAPASGAREAGPLASKSKPELQEEPTVSVGRERAAKQTLVSKESAEQHIVQSNRDLASALGEFNRLENYPEAGLAKQKEAARALLQSHEDWESAQYALLKAGGEITSETEKKRTELKPALDKARAILRAEEAASKAEQASGQTSTVKKGANQYPMPSEQYRALTPDMRSTGSAAVQRFNTLYQNYIDGTARPEKADLLQLSLDFVEAAEAFDAFQEKCLKEAGDLPPEFNVYRDHIYESDLRNAKAYIAQAQEPSVQIDQTESAAQDAPERPVLEQQDLRTIKDAEDFYGNLDDESPEDVVKRAEKKQKQEERRDRRQERQQDRKEAKQEYREERKTALEAEKERKEAPVRTPVMELRGAESEDDFIASLAEEPAGEPAEPSGAVEQTERLTVFEMDDKLVGDVQRSLTSMRQKLANFEQTLELEKKTGEPYEPKEDQIVFAKMAIAAEDAVLDSQALIKSTHGEVPEELKVTSEDRERLQRAYKFLQENAE